MYGTLLCAKSNITININTGDEVVNITGENPFVVNLSLRNYHLFQVLVLKGCPEKYQ